MERLLAIIECKLQAAQRPIVEQQQDEGQGHEHGLLIRPRAKKTRERV